MPNKKKLRNIIWIFLTTAVLLVLLLLCYRSVRGHGKIIVSEETFKESSRKLNNPYRGFYYINDFYITDNYVDYRDLVAEIFARDEENTLSLIEINISEYKNGPISKDGLANIDKLMEQLTRYDKQYIVRVLYDWDGEAKDNEPKSLEIVLGHMEQIGPILTKYQGTIFCLQGLFVGNWGEMHGTSYVDNESLKLLYNKLSEVTPEDMYLSVRTPAQWRVIMEQEEPYSNRLGLYNDGMLGSSTDCGTYGEESKSKVGMYSSWVRNEELEFQEELCQQVPLGGEVIRKNTYNDFENALKDMNQMHVTYLNQSYDLEVLSKWDNTTVDFDESYNGMQGQTYVERHMGYRLLIDEAKLKVSNWKDAVEVSIDMKNVGFAPVYMPCEAWIVVYNEASGIVESYLLEEDIRALSGGNQKNELLNLKYTIKLFGKASGDYQVYLNLIDIRTGKQIEFANEQDITKYGYLVGRIILK